MKIRSKFNLASACLILAVVIGLMVTLYSTEKHQLWSDIQEEQTADLIRLAGVCEQSMIITSDELMLINYVKSLMVSPKVSFAGYVAPDGTGWIYSRDNKFELFQGMDPEIRSIIKSNHILRQDLKSSSGENVIALSMPVRDSGYVRLGYSRDVVNELFQSSLNVKLKRLLWVGVVAILIGFIIAQLLGRALSRPIQLLDQAATDIAQGKKGIQIPVYGKDELSRLTKTFNHMSVELSKLDELKDDFMSHVTHELRSPLTSIMATVELLAENPMMGKDPRFKRSIDRLTYGSERLNRLIDNILDLTKIESGKMPFDIQAMQIRKLLFEMADFFEPRCAEKNLKIKTDVPNQLPLALADPERIRQILSNLIHNAIKFTNQGEIVLIARKRQQNIQVAVKDTGVGIPSDKLHTIFEKFECLSDTRNRVDKPVPGSGLGLNIVLNSIKAQNGNIWVESELNKGTTFIFTLPLAPSNFQRQSSDIGMEPLAPNNSEAIKESDAPSLKSKAERQ